MQAGIAVGAPGREAGPGRDPRITPPPVHPQGLRIVVPPGSAICLRCRWAALTGDAGAEARRHTRLTAHPTIYRPVTPPGDDQDEPM